jgi:transcriptional regulator with XRE-family HTH domain
VTIAEASAVVRKCKRCGTPLSRYKSQLTCGACIQANEVTPHAGGLSRPIGVPADDTGAVLRAWRASMGRSQAETAGLLGMTQQNLSQIENGRQPMPFEQRQRAVTVLGISAEDLGLSPGRPRAELDAAVAVDQARWRQERRWLNQHRSAVAAAESRRAATRGRHRWQRSPDAAYPSAVRAGPVFDRYTSAIRHLDPPRLFESRPSYRLLSDHLSMNALHFGLAAYFDKIDVSEALGRELAIACLREHNGVPRSVEPLREALPFRTLIGDPFDSARRAIIPAVTTLTIRLRRYPAEPRFLLHWRDPAKVATAAGVYDVIPAGEFQPASVALWDRRNDFDL